MTGVLAPDWCLVALVTGHVRLIGARIVNLEGEVYTTPFSMHLL